MEKKKLSFLCVLRNAIQFAAYLKETLRRYEEIVLSKNEGNIPAVLSEDELLSAKAFLKDTFDDKYHADLPCGQTTNS